MKNFIFTFLATIFLSTQLSGQISYSGCTGVIAAPYPFTLNLSGNDGTRNIYTSALPGPSCSAGVCAFRVIWTGTQWEIQLSTNGGASFGFTLYTNSMASLPNPPDLSLGTWNGAVPCAGQPLSTLSGDVQSTISLLPVDIISFSGKIDSKTVHLQWQTASELNNEKFEIESSTNNLEFKKIGEIKGNGTNNELQEYSFNVEKPQYGTSYYRLKQIDFDGQFEYSNIVTVDFKENYGKIGGFYPNPTNTGMVSLNYTSNSVGDIDISFYDMAGKLFIIQNYSISKGKNSLSFNISALNKGIYLVKIDNKLHPVYRKLVIN